MLTSIVMFLLKIIGGAVVLYFIAAFIVSLKRLLPILCILSSIALIVLLYFVGGKDEYLLIIIILGLFNQLCFQGEGYMEEHVVENAYRVVSVERKWNSLFAEFDDYEIHLSPKLIGGFIENTIFMGIFFGVYYFLFGGTSIQYFIPIFYLLRSIVDLVYIYIYQPSGSVAWATNIFCVLFSILLSAYVIPDNTVKIKISYKDCEKYIVLDYSMSYEAEYHEYIVVNGYEKDRRSSLYFEYDSYLNAGGYYHSSDPFRENKYQKIVYRDVRFNNELVQFNVNGANENKYDFANITKEVGDLYKYDTAEGFVENLDYTSYLELTKEKYDNFIITVNDNNTVRLTYTCEISDDNKYTIYYDLNCNKIYKPTSLKSIKAKIYTAVNCYHEVSYTPLYEEASDTYGVLGNTDLKDRFYYDYDYYDYVPGNEDDAPLFLIGYKYEEPEPEKETYGIDFEEVISNLKGKEDVLSNYDFTLEDTLYGGDPCSYVYDSESNIVAFYRIDDYPKYKEATSNNDFSNNTPYSYIFNDLYCYINLGYEEDIYFEEDEFIKYTATDKKANNVIVNAFVNFEYDDELDYRYENGEVKLVISFINPLIADEYAKYIFYFSENELGKYENYKIEVRTTMGSHNYVLTMYYKDVFDIYL